jgi:hypothetical protein
MIKDCILAFYTFMRGLSLCERESERSVPFDVSSGKKRYETILFIRTHSHERLRITKGNLCDGCWRNARYRSEKEKEIDERIFNFGSKVFPYEFQLNYERSGSSN